MSRISNHQRNLRDWIARLERQVEASHKYTLARKKELARYKAKLAKLEKGKA